MSRLEVKVTGFGGQGVILTGHILGKAASLFDGKFATMTQAFGPEARGSACSSQIVIDEERVLYPYVKKPSILVCMSQDAYTKFEPELADDGLLVVEKDLVSSVKPRGKIRVFACPATRLAEKLGRKIVLNIVMLGFFGAVCEIVSAEALRKAVEDSVPKGTESLNLKAFDTGYEYGRKAMSGESIDE